MNKLFKQAFTLIELLVVIAIIGILSGLIVVSMGGMTQKASIARSQIFANSLRNSLMMNLVSEWKLDGDAKDSWGGLDGAITGAVLVTSGCVQGSCYDFNGDDYMEVPYNSKLKPTTRITFGVWGYRDDWGNSPSNTRLLSCTETGGYNMIVNINDAGTQIYANSSYFSASFYGSTTVPSSGWHYFVTTFDGRYLKPYLDGVLKTPTDAGGTYSIGYTNNNSLFLGAEAGPATGPVSGSYFVGKIDEVRIYNESVPVSQIQEQYYLGLNNLFMNGNITTKEYSERINLIAKQ